MPINLRQVRSSRAHTHTCGGPQPATSPLSQLSLDLREQKPLLSENLKRGSWQSRGTARDWPLCIFSSSLAVAHPNCRGCQSLTYGPTPPRRCRRHLHSPTPRPFRFDYVERKSHRMLHCMSSGEIAALLCLQLLIIKHQSFKSQVEFESETPPSRTWKFTPALHSSGHINLSRWRSRVFSCPSDQQPPGFKVVISVPPFVFLVYLSCIV